MFLGTKYKAECSLLHSHEKQPVRILDDLIRTEQSKHDNALNDRDIFSPNFWESFPPWLSKDWPLS